MFLKKDHHFGIAPEHLRHSVGVALNPEARVTNWRNTICTSPNFLGAKPA